jgi:hypothetical protein
MTPEVNAFILITLIFISIFLFISSIYHRHCSYNKLLFMLFITIIIYEALRVFFLMNSSQISLSTSFHIGSCCQVWLVKDLNKEFYVPFQQIIISMIFMFSLMIYFNKIHHYICIGLLCILLAVSLGIHKEKITIGSDIYINNIKLIGKINYYKKGIANSFVYRYLKCNQILNYNKSYIFYKGWLENTDIKQHLSKNKIILFDKLLEISNNDLQLCESKTEWYTSITGIYKIKYLPTDFWYKGGEFNEKNNNIEIRLK